jgi:hypothetical protein
MAFVSVVNIYRETKMKEFLPFKNIFDSLIERLWLCRPKAIVFGLRVIFMVI